MLTEKTDISASDSQRIETSTKRQKRNIDFPDVLLDFQVIIASFISNLTHLKGMAHVIMSMSLIIWLFRFVNSFLFCIFQRMIF